MAHVDVVTFCHGRDLRDRISADFHRYWGNAPVKLHLAEFGKREHTLRALSAARFETSTLVENSNVVSVLDKLGWERDDNLMLFDDIIFAPLMVKFGSNSILSPHDCMSSMFRAHLEHSLIPDLRKYVQFRLARLYEKRYFHHALLTHVISHRDRVCLEMINPQARFHVIPNADLQNPLVGGETPVDHDLMIWGDLSVSAISSGVKQIVSFLREDKGWLKRTRILMVGKVPLCSAKKILGDDLTELCEYAQWLEDESGMARSAKINVVPDLGGAGMKNRCINLLAAGKCLACLYLQMEGIEKASDTGAINAGGIRELLRKIKPALVSGSYQLIADAGKRIYEKEYNRGVITEQWREMIERSLWIRHGARDSQ